MRYEFYFTERRYLQYIVDAESLHEAVEIYLKALNDDRVVDDSYITDYETMPPHSIIALGGSAPGKRLYLGDPDTPAQMWSKFMGQLIAESRPLERFLDQDEGEPEATPERLSLTYVLEVGPTVEPDPDGKYIRYVDYEALEEERDRLREALKDIERVRTNWAHGIDENMERLRTIATRALGEEEDSND